jgi:hypothetical protein
VSLIFDFSRLSYRYVPKTITGATAMIYTSVAFFALKVSRTQ